MFFHDKEYSDIPLSQNYEEYILIFNRRYYFVDILFVNDINMQRFTKNKIEKNVDGLE